MITRIHSVAIVVSDYDRALRFYRDALGFEVTADVTDPNSSENRWLTLKPKGAETNLMLLKPSPRQPELSARIGKPTNIVLETDDLDVECERIKAGGGREVGAPKLAGWGAAMEAHFADPDGNGFLLVQRRMQ